MAAQAAGGAGGAATRALRVAVVGDVGVGKTSLCAQFAYGVFPLDHERTVVRWWSRTVPLTDVSVRFTLVDTSSMGSAPELLDDAVLGADAALVLFDVSSLASFVRVTEFAARVRAATRPALPLFVIGNKNDLAATRVVQDDEAVALAAYLRGHYVDITCRSMDNVMFVFRTLAAFCLLE